MNRYLQHHGVEGQKWGVRRYQNEDGSLTALGKERYFSKESHDNVYSSVKANSFGNTYGKVSTNADVQEIREVSEFLVKQGEIVIDKYNTYEHKVEESVDKILSDKELRQPILERFKEDFGSYDQIDDDEFFTMIAEEHISDAVRSMASKEYTDYEKSADTFFDNTSAAVEDLVGEYGNTPISAWTNNYRSLFPKKQTSLYKDMVDELVKNKADYGLIAHLYKNTDYAFDTDKYHESRNKLIDVLEKEFKDMGNSIEHDGVKGMQRGVRRYQNEDGTWTDLGLARRRAERAGLSERERKKIDKKDSKWANKNYKKIYKNTYKKSEKELRSYLKEDLNPQFKGQRINATYVNAYNKKLADLMNKNVGDISAPSGRVVKFIAKRGEVGVHMALADDAYDMSEYKNGIWGSGRVAYRKKTVERV